MKRISAVLLLLVAACGEDSDNVNPLAPSAVADPGVAAGLHDGGAGPVPPGAGADLGAAPPGVCTLRWSHKPAPSGWTVENQGVITQNQGVISAGGTEMELVEGEHVDALLTASDACAESVSVRNVDLLGSLELKGGTRRSRRTYADSPANLWGSPVDNSITTEEPRRIRFRAGRVSADLIVSDDDAQLTQPDPLRVTLEAPPSASPWTPNQSYGLGHVLNWNNAQGDSTFPNLVNHVGWWIRTRQATYGTDGGRPGSAQYPLFPNEPNDWDPASTVRTVEIQLDRPWAAGDYRIRLRAVGSARLTPWETSSRAAVANDFRSAILTVPSGRGFQHESVTVVCPSRVTRNGSTRPARRGTVRLQVLAPYQGVEVRPNQVRVC